MLIVGTKRKKETEKLRDRELLMLTKFFDTFLLKYKNINLKYTSYSKKFLFKFSISISIILESTTRYEFRDITCLFF